MLKRRLLCPVVLLLVAVGITSACNSDRSGRFVATERDGVRYVDVAWETAPLVEIDTVPDLILGGTDAPDRSFYGIRDVAMVGDSQLVVVDGSEQQLVLVDLVGTETRRLGRRGAGPVEFQGLSQVLPTRAETLLVFDEQRRRLVEVTLAGELVEEVRVPETFSAGHGLVLLQAGSLDIPALRIGLIPGFEGNADGRPRRGRGALVSLVDPGDTLATFPGPSLFVSDMMAGGVLFGARTHLAGSDDGVWVGDNSARQVELWSPDQGLTAVVRWTSRESRQLSGPRITELWSRLENSLPPDQRPAVEAMRSAMPVADSIPAFGSLVAAPGAVWIGSFQPPEAELLEENAPPQTWLVVQLRSGTALRTVTPAGFQLILVGEDFIVGVQRDEMGVETVRRYRIRMPSWGA